MGKKSIFIAGSRQHQHLAELLTDLLTDQGHVVVSFVGMDRGKSHNSPPAAAESKNPGADAQWVDTNARLAAAGSVDLVIYAGGDASAELGAAWQANVTTFGLWTEGQPLNPYLVHKWFTDYRALLRETKTMTAGAC